MFSQPRGAGRAGVAGRAGLAGAVACLLAGGAMAVMAAMPQAVERPVAGDADDIGGGVPDANGPEAGVWVIAETRDFPTTLRKIVVTDDRGRFLLPDLPSANYRVWV